MINLNETQKKYVAKISTPLLISVFIILFLARIFAFVEENNKWNGGAKKIRDALRQADSIQIVNDLRKGEVVGFIDAQEEIHRMLGLVELEPNVEVSFWKVPMVRHEVRKQHGFCMDYLKIWFYSNGRRVGCIWINKERRKLTFFPCAANGRLIVDQSEEGVLTKNAYENIAIWFLGYGLPQYIKWKPQ